MVEIIMSQHRTTDGIFVTLTLSEESAIIVYAREEETGKVYELVEVLSKRSHHFVSLKVPPHHGNAIIVAHAIH